MDLLAALQKDFLVGDGGYGATILSLGLAAGECEESWNLTHPDKIEQLHRQFVAAGSELIQPNTLKANHIFLNRLDLADKTAEINRAGVEIARRAAGDKAFVAASIGPIGELLEPYGTLSREDAQSAFARQAEALASAQPDAIIIETFTAIEEAELAIAAAKATGLPVIASMSFQASGATVMGVKPEPAAKRLAGAGADVVGANCGIGPVELFPIMQEFVRAAVVPTIAQPNAGMPKLVSGKTVFPETPENMAAYALRFRDLGVKIIGGCCGTKPEHIAAMVKALRG